MSDVLAALARGGVAGFAATTPMTAVMQLLRRALPPEQRDPLEPQRVALRAAAKAGLDDDLSPGQKGAWVVLAHFGYGSGAGAAFGPLARLLPAHPLVSGFGYGAAVWAAGYLGWLPLAGLYPPPTREPAGRVAENFAAHLVWGAGLGLMLHLLDGESSRGR